MSKTGGAGERLRVGTVGRAFGLKGHVRVIPATDDPERFYDLETAWLEDNGAFTEVTIAEADVNQGTVTLRFEGVEDRTAAECLNGKPLYVSREDAVEPPPGAHFITDIIGCAVTDDAGKPLGSVADVLQHGAADVWVLRGGACGEVMFPALKAVLKSVDVKAKKIVVDAARFQEVAVFEG